MEDPVRRYAVRGLSLVLCGILLVGPVARTELRADEPARSPAVPKAGTPADLRVPGPNAGAEVRSDRAVPDAEPIDRALPGAEPALSAELKQLRTDLRRCLDHYYAQRFDVATFTPWDIMHMLIAFGVDTKVRASGRDVNAIGWLCWNLPCRGQRLLRVVDGRVYGTVGYGVEGHQGQFLAMLAQSRVPATFELRVAGRKFTVEDLVKSEMRTCQSGKELTFKLIGLAHYLPSDAKWKSQNGESWSIPKLIREEMKQPISGAACGGTHRMMGFAYAVYKRRRRGEPITGEWKRAETYVKDYHKYMFTLQNPNGSFSTNWFEGRGDSGNIDRYLQTTGHMLEFLVFSLPEDQLDDPRVVRSVRFLVDLMLKHRERGWHVGARGHALHALEIYHQRFFKAEPGYRTRPQRIARRATTQGTGDASPKREPQSHTQSSGGRP